MGLSGTIDGSVYEGLKDVLQRYPISQTVAYEPDSIVKKFLRLSDRSCSRRTTDRTGIAATGR